MQPDRTIYLASQELKLAKECTLALSRLANAAEALAVFVTGKPVEPPMASEEPKEPAALPETSGEAATPPPAPEEPPITKADLRAFLCLCLGIVVFTHDIVSLRCYFVGIADFQYSTRFPPVLRVTPLHLHVYPP